MCLLNVLVIGRHMWDSIHNLFEDLVHGNTVFSKESKKIKENIENPK